MITLLAKSIRFNRFHTAIVILFVVCLVWILLRYAAMIEANVERFAYTNNLQLIHRMLEIQHLLARKTQKNCAFLNDPNLFQQVTASGFKPSGIALQKSPSWQYDSTAHILTYNVRSTTYFRATASQQIHLLLGCKDDNVIYKLSPHQWCSRPSIWGCKQWS